MNEFVDMHVHSKFSIDGMSTMEDYCLIAGKTGTRVICFTEHVDFNSAEKNLSIVKDMILSIMIDKNILLEVNTSSLNDSCDEPMPSYSVINRYVQLGGNKIVIGSDAHSSDRLSGHFRDVVPRLPNRIQIGYFRERKFIPVLMD